MLFFIYTIHAQEVCVRSILNSHQKLGNYIVSDYLDFDFSPVWKNAKAQVSIGAIGENQDPISFQIINVIKNGNDPSDYMVFGQTTVKGVKSEFSGRIIIQNIQEIINTAKIDNIEYALLAPRIHGLIEAHYVFNERRGKGQSGFFSGKLVSKWFITHNDTVYYDDSDKKEEGYFNNAYLGIWKNYLGNDQKIAYWSDFSNPYYECSSQMAKTSF